MNLNAVIEDQCSYLRTYLPNFFNNRAIVTKESSICFVFKNAEFLSPVFATELGAILIQQITLNARWEKNGHVFKVGDETLVAVSLCTAIVAVNHRGDKTREEYLASGQQYSNIIYVLNKAANRALPVMDFPPTLPISMQGYLEHKKATPPVIVSVPKEDLVIPKQTEPVVQKQAPPQIVVEVGERSVLRVPMCDELPVCIKSLTMLMQQQLPEGSWSPGIMKELKRAYGLYQAYRVKNLPSIHGETHYYFSNGDKKTDPRMTSKDNAENERFWRLVTNDGLGTGMLYLFKDEVARLLNTINVDVQFIELATIKAEPSNYFWVYLHGYGAVEQFNGLYKFTENLELLCGDIKYKKLSINKRLYKDTSYPSTVEYLGGDTAKATEFFIKIMRLCAVDIKY